MGLSLAFAFKMNCETCNIETTIVFLLFMVPGINTTNIY